MGTTCMKTNANTCATIMLTCALLLTPKSISAATLQAATAKQSDVYEASLRATDGDTVVVPSTLSLPGGAAICTTRIHVSAWLPLRLQRWTAAPLGSKPQ